MSVKCVTGAGAGTVTPAPALSILLEQPMLGLYVMKLRWELHDAAWAHLVGDNQYANEKLLSITKRYLKHVSKEVSSQDEQIAP